MRKREGTLSEVLNELKQTSDATETDRVSLGRLVDALDERGYGALLAILPLLELTPIGGIPTFPTFLATTIAVLTVRMMLGYDHVWLPDWARRKKLDSERTERALGWLTPIALRIDGKLHARLERLTGSTAERLAGVAILCLVLTVPPLELIPFATSGPMIIISLFGMAILFRDGLLMLLGIGGMTAGLVALVWFLVGG